MKPAHELTTDEAVLELEQVCDQLSDMAPVAPIHLQKRQHELEAWILMHQGALQNPPIESIEEPETMAKPSKQTEEEKRAKAREYNRKWAAKKRAEQRGDKPETHTKAPKVNTSAEHVRETPKSAHVGLDRPYEAAIDLGRAIERHHTKPVALDAITSRLVHLQGQVLGVTAEVVGLPTVDRGALLEVAANLDALAHQLAQFLATGRIEVAA